MSQILKTAIIAKLRHMAPVPELNTTDEQQPAPKKRRDFFVAVIDSPVHDVTPTGQQCGHLTIACSPEEADP